MKEDCLDEIYTNDLDPSITGAEATSNPDVQPQPAKGETPIIKQENGLAEEEDEEVLKESPPRAIDWQSRYEDFNSLLARFETKLCEAKDITSAISDLEAVAQIANHYDAVQFSSPVTRIITQFFNHCCVERQLWEPIAKDAARWLRIAILLKKVSIFDEAFDFSYERKPGAKPKVKKSESDLE